MNGAAVDVVTDPIALQYEVEQFLYREAGHLDGWRLDEWLALFTEDAEYRVPTTDLPAGEGGEVLDIIFDDMVRLRGRVDRLKTRFAYREFPFSRTRRFVTNVRIASEGEVLRVTSNFLIYRLRNGDTDDYMGEYEHELVRIDGGLRIRRKYCRLDLEALRPHSTVSIIV